jgi:hypothetical protein
MEGQSDVRAVHMDWSKVIFPAGDGAWKLKAQASNRLAVQAVGPTVRRRHRHTALRKAEHGQKFHGNDLDAIVRLAFDKTEI